MTPQLKFLFGWLEGLFLPWEERRRICIWERYKCIE